MTPDPFDPYVPPAESPAAMPPAAGGETYVGPFDREAFPARLTARVVEPGADARIHGYHVAGDLARHHGPSDVLWLALRGELPTEGERAALDAACVLLAPVHLGQAAAHAAYLARIAGAPASATVAIAAVGLGELVRVEREALAPWLAWLDRTSASPRDAHGDAVPACALAAETSDESIAAQRWLDGRMRAWFGPDRGLPPAPLGRVACAYALLHRLGVRGPLAVETVAVWARLPAVAAEAAHAKAGGVRDYPARLPDYRYADEEGAAA